jgi:hypothetical protein
MYIFHFFCGCYKKNNIETPTAVNKNAVILSQSDINKLSVAMINQNEGYGFCINDSVNIIKDLKLDQIKKPITIL